MIAGQLSESTEMYLKAMAELGEGEVVSISRLAERLSVTSVSANEMVRRLSEQGLVSHLPYKGVNLTSKGRDVACNVVRRQRLWECFLYNHLKLEWAQLYELACSLEHATAPEVTDALAVFLGNPKTCPHGNPIPDADGCLPELNSNPLSTVPVGDTVRVVSVRATSTEVLRHLQKLSLLPGREVTLLEAAPMDGPLMLKVGDREAALGLLMAEFVFVEPIS
ncbi:MAG: metal-dependent transcriptional regulator [Anaerolineales bacterium]|nr:metal-dependent transcriptional regulator [Anaerolineales bacterium]